MADLDLTVLYRLLAALVAGSVIGVERSFRGRPAGFRTHALVCLASGLLMLVSVYAIDWTGVQDQEGISVDPLRMAQGIMTGIGFVGAGAIIKDGLTVRGLTTAASLWITAALGILAGIGFFVETALGTVLALGSLSVFHAIERRMPSEVYAAFSIRFRPGKAMSMDALRELLGTHGLAARHLAYYVDSEEDRAEYRVALRSLRMRNFEALAATLGERGDVASYRIEPTGNPVTEG